MRLFALAGCLLAISFPAFAQAPIPTNQLVTKAIEGFIRAGFSRFAETTESLRTGLETLCATPTADAATKVQAEFKDVVLAFSHVEFIRIGPLGVGDRLERLLFWPDRKGIALRQVQGALAAEDATAADAETLKGKSVAMQGLGALEYLLFGTDAESLGTATGAYRCRYAGAIATLVDGLADEISTEWQDPAGVTEALVHPKADAADYRTETEVLEKLAATMVHGTEAIRDQRLTPVLGAPGDKPKPRSALFWRSGMTGPALLANFVGLQEFFEKTRFADALGAENGWITNGAVFEFGNAERAARLIGGSMDAAVVDPKQLQALKYLVIVTGSLDTIVGQNLAAALGLSVGFSALDGD